MDELDISGKRYISTRRAGREHGYHSDYMGQLIRGKKVAGQKVGRSWYIDEESLLAYLGKAPEVAATVAAAPAPVATPEPVAAPVAELLPPVKEVAQEPVHIPHVEPVAPAPIAAQEPVAVRTHELVREAEEVRIPIHTPAPAYKPTQAPVAAPSYIHHEVIGGLRYAEDTAPSMPVVSRMTVQPAYASNVYAQNEASDDAYDAPVAHAAPRASHEGSSFPFVSLSLIAAVTLGAALFASNFVTATVVAEPGKTASVQYAIHW